MNIAISLQMFLGLLSDADKHYFHGLHAVHVFSFWEPYSEKAYWLNAQFLMSNVKFHNILTYLTLFFSF